MKDRKKRVNKSALSDFYKNATDAGMLPKLREESSDVLSAV